MLKREMTQLQRGRISGKKKGGGSGRPPRSTLSKSTNGWKKIKVQRNGRESCCNLQRGNEHARLQQNLKIYGRR